MCTTNCKRPVSDTEVIRFVDCAQCRSSWKMSKDGHAVNEVVEVQMSTRGIDGVCIRWSSARSELLKRLMYYRWSNMSKVHVDR